MASRLFAFPTMFRTMGIKLSCRRDAIRHDAIRHALATWKRLSAVALTKPIGMH